MRGLYRLKLLRRRVEDKLRLRSALTAIRDFPKVSEKKPHGLGRPLVVTLTSYPPRYGHLDKTLKSLLDQTMPADRVELWIAQEEMDQLPPQVRSLEEHGLQIKSCRNIRSYKKLVPALEQDPDCFYVTADDDVFYGPDWLSSLVSAAQRHERAVIGTRVHRAYLRPDRRMTPYSDWEHATDREQIDSDEELLFPTGVGGVLYPPGCFDEQVLDETTFMELCPRGDDIWFFWMARKAGTLHRRTAEWFHIVEWPDSQDVALYSDNMLSDGNDRQIAAMEERFGPVPPVDGAKGGTAS